VLELGVSAAAATSPFSLAAGRFPAVQELCIASAFFFYSLSSSPVPVCTKAWTIVADSLVSSSPVPVCTKAWTIVADSLADYLCSDRSSALAFCAPLSISHQHQQFSLAGGSMEPATLTQDVIPTMKCVCPIGRRSLRNQCIVPFPFFRTGMHFFISFLLRALSCLGYTGRRPRSIGPDTLTVGAQSMMVKFHFLWLLELRMACSIISTGPSPDVSLGGSLLEFHLYLISCHVSILNDMTTF
jgi:hypothetical protein